MAVPKPAEIHGRERIWESLSDFATSDVKGTRLGLVYGRRRQGKTLMLDLLARATQGFIFTGLPQAGPLNLRRLARAYGQFTAGPTPAFADWEEAVDQLLRLGERQTEPLLVVLDEFPYLMVSEPALPSILQIALEPTSRARRQGRTRLVLCGSALHTMRGLLSGSAPLRGRADYEIMVHPFGYREAAQFWGVIDKPDLAFRVHALLGGTPAYRDMCGVMPDSVRGFDDWVVRGPLNPDRAIYREGAVLLHEEPSLSDLGLYYSVLSAIANGAHRRSQIGATLERPDTALAHPLAVLEQTQLLERVEDAFRQKRPVYRIAEPVLRLHQLVIAPNEAELVGGNGSRVWAESEHTVRSRIYGPHFEELARQWCLQHAAGESLGGRASTVRSAALACGQHKVTHELDVVVVQRQPGTADTVLAIGEAKGTTGPVGEDELHRLEHLRDLIPADRYASPPRLLLFSLGGFSPALLRQVQSRTDVELIDIDRLYRGA